MLSEVVKRYGSLCPQNFLWGNSGLQIGTLGYPKSHGCWSIREETGGRGY